MRNSDSIYEVERNKGTHMTLNAAFPMHSHAYAHAPAHVHANTHVHATHIDMCKKGVTLYIVMAEGIV